MKKLFLLLLAAATITSLKAQQTPSTDSLQEYTGKYKFPDGSAVTEVNITIENGVLFAAAATGSSELRRIEKDLFEIVAYSGKAFFKRDETAKLNGVRIEIEDLILEGTKEISAVRFVNSSLSCTK